MKILDKFNCQYCGKEVVLEVEDNDEFNIDRYEVDCACKDCYNNISLIKMEHDFIIEREWWEIQSYRDY